MKTFMEGRNWEELNPGVYDVEVEFVLSEEVNMVQSIKAYILITKIEETE